MPITLTLTPEQEAWLQAQVAAGDFATVEEAARRLLDDRIAQIASRDEDDDLEWARPLLDEARASIARGESLTLEEHRARNVIRRASRER
jgi:antitoxin ParD1/3/4